VSNVRVIGAVRVAGPAHQSVQPTSASSVSVDRLRELSTNPLRPDISNGFQSEHSGRAVGMRFDVVRRMASDF
jgi:hypothetical protein